MVVNSQAFLFALIALLVIQLPSLMAADCPLDLTSSNFILVASMCSNTTNRGKCCRYMNAFVSISVAHYANHSTNLGVPPNLSETCIASISKTMELYGVSRNAINLCGLGTKILVKYKCEGRTTVKKMHQSPRFGHVSRKCRLPLSPGKFRECLNSDSFPPLESPAPSPSTVDAMTPSSSDSLMTPSERSYNLYRLTMVTTIGIVVIAVSLTMLVVLVILIRRKSRELDESESLDQTSNKIVPYPRHVFKFHEDNSSTFRKFNYKEIRNATNDFSTVIGHGGFGTVYKAEFSDGLIAAVKNGQSH